MAEGPGGIAAGDEEEEDDEAAAAITTQHRVAPRAHNQLKV
jgi:hypothetical protein